MSTEVPWSGGLHIGHRFDLLRDRGILLRQKFADFFLINGMKLNMNWRVLVQTGGLPFESTYHSISTNTLQKCSLGKTRLAHKSCIYSLKADTFFNCL